MPDLTVSYDPATDNQCVITHGGTFKVAGINGGTPAVLAVSWIHPDKDPGCEETCVRVYGSFPTREEAERFIDMSEALVPTLDILPVEVCAPFLTIRSWDRVADGMADVMAKCTRLTAAHTERMSRQNRTVHTELERDTQESAEARAASAAATYRTYQLNFVRSAGVFMCTADEIDDVAQTMREGGMSVAKARTETRKRRSKQRRRKQRKQRRRREEVQQTKGKYVKGVSSASLEHRSLVPQWQKVGAVAILLDDEPDGGEHLVFFLGVFGSVEDLNAWVHANHRYMRRYHVYDVPLWEWWSPEKRVLDTNVQTLFAHPQQQLLHDQLNKDSAGDTDLAAALASKKDGLLQVSSEPRTEAEDAEDAEAFAAMADFDE